MVTPVSVNAERRCPLVALGGQYAVPERFTATVTPDDNATPVCHLLIVVKDRRPACQGLTLEAGSACHQIDGATLRGVRLADYVSRAIDAVALWVIPADDPSAQIFVSARGGSGSRFRRSRSVIATSLCAWSASAGPQKARQRCARRAKQGP